jgi:uncharacterized protein YjiS (DUF1127 family)
MPIRITRLEPSLPRNTVFLLVLRSMATTIKEWLHTRRAERELHALDDRYLEDMGISRSEISNAVRGNHSDGARTPCRAPIFPR